MADTNAKNILSVISTTSARLPALAIKNGQLIFIQDKERIALDWNGQRRFYNQITLLQTEADRIALEAPVDGGFYFVVGTAVLWCYTEGTWIQCTSAPKEVIFIGDTLPELGSEQTLYIDKTNKEISVWDDKEKKYNVVSDVTKDIADEDIDTLF